MPNYALELDQELDNVQSAADFCTDWKTKYRPIAVTVQGILNLVFPAGAKVVGFLIAIADQQCP